MNPDSAPPPALVLDASHRQSLAAVRALGRAGIETWAADWTDRYPASVSRWCKGTARLPDVAEDADGFAGAVIELCQTLGSPVVIPSHDGSIDALRAHRHELEQVGTLALAREEALSVAIDKRSTLAAAGRLGIPVPPTHTVTNAEATADAIDDLGFPLVIKPVTSWVMAGPGGWGRGPSVVHGKEAALAMVNQLLDGGSPALLQSWLSGNRDEVGVFLAGNAVHAKFAVRSQRMLPLIGGDSIVRETIPVLSDIGTAAEDLVREIQLEGYSDVEFRRDERGEPFLMEINPRLNAGVEVAIRAGVNIPVLLYSWAAGESLEPVLEYHARQRMRWLNGDIRWLAEVVADPGHPDAPARRAALWRFLADFARPGGYDYLDRADLRPALREAARLAQLLPAAAGARMRNWSNGKYGEPLRRPPAQASRMRARPRSGRGLGGVV